MDDWKIFWFDGNQAWEVIESADDWTRIQNAYRDRLGDLKSALSSVAGHGTGEGYMLSFGFRMEHDSKPTLGEWAKENNMCANLGFEQLFPE